VVKSELFYITITLQHFIGEHNDIRGGLIFSPEAYAFSKLKTKIIPYSKRLFQKNLCSILVNLWYNDRENKLVGSWKHSNHCWRLKQGTSDMGEMFLLG
jgi:hypothetical protein